MQRKTHDGQVEKQFGPRAQDYVTSTVHATGEDLQLVGQLARLARPRRALDLGCGGGHVAYALAAEASSVVACDASQEMIEAVRVTAGEKGFTNVEAVCARAEDLPFDSGTFEFLACRYSAHHWTRVQDGLREARRVLKRGCKAVFIDSCSPGLPLLDTHLQVLELLRDVSHVRSYALAEWVHMLASNHFNILGVRTWQLRMDFPTWTARMRTPDLNRQMLLTLQSGASDEVRTSFAIEPDGSFMLPIAMLEVEAV
jgi:ubiquinone/menaquinone biosynthesis C-methylase UbiE